MSKPRRTVTVVVHRDGDIDSRTFKFPVWLFEALKIGSGVFVVLVVIGAILYAPVARTAARVPGMSDEIARLSMENSQVRQLAETLDSLEQRYDQMRTALGANILPEPGDVADGAIPVGLVLHARLPTDSMDNETGPSEPSHWPLDSIFQPGVLTQRQTLEDGPGVQHGGVDIAVRAGTQIRAAGGGTVREAGYDVEYGWFVLIDHPDDYQTMYGHASRLLVAAQDSVDAGQVIALAGSTGRSTAPHLHFEKRRGNQLIDPLERLNKEQ